MFGEVKFPQENIGKKEEGRERKDRSGKEELPENRSN